MFFYASSLHRVSVLITKRDEDERDFVFGAKYLGYKSSGNIIFSITFVVIQPGTLHPHMWFQITN